MAYNKKSIRRMKPTTKKMAKLVNELELTTRRLKRLLQEVDSIELDSMALHNKNKHDGKVKLGVIDAEGHRLGPDKGSLDLFSREPNGKETE